MTSLVDIHSHILPGIDDGPPDEDGALAMARAAAEAGIDVLAATPHLRSDFPGVRIGEIAERCARMNEVVRAAGLDLRIVPGAETSLIWALDASDEELRLASYGQAGKDLLIETPSDVSLLEQLLYSVRIRGFRVTLAHPERSGVFKQDPERLEALAAQGVLLQVNADALLAPRRSTTRALAEHLCREGIAHALASDGHRGAEWRPVSALAPAVAALGSLVGAPRARWMACDAPAAIVEGRELPDAPEIGRPSRGLFRRRIRS